MRNPPPPPNIFVNFPGYNAWIGINKKTKTKKKLNKKKSGVMRWLVSFDADANYNPDLADLNPYINIGLHEFMGTPGLWSRYASNCRFSHTHPPTHTKYRPHWKTIKRYRIKLCKITNCLSHILVLFSPTPNEINMSQY